MWDFSEKETVSLTNIDIKRRHFHVSMFFMLLSAIINTTVSQKKRHISFENQYFQIWKSIFLEMLIFKEDMNIFLTTHFIFLDFRIFGFRIFGFRIFYTFQTHNFFSWDKVGDSNRFLKKHLRFLGPWYFLSKRIVCQTFLARISGRNGFHRFRKNQFETHFIISLFFCFEKNTKVVWTK